MVWEVVKHWLCGRKYCVLDVPLLIEGPIWKWVAQVAVVYWYVATNVFTPSANPVFLVPRRYNLSD